MLFDSNNTIYDFKLINKNHIPEIKYAQSNIADAKCCAYEMIHKSGAKLLYLQNDDPEMAFSISFKTLPQDSTGVFHILEHSVLCGSRKFPVKEPFTSLLKSSMQTFLNAMTYPDKTVYPVASTNVKDFYNLIDVYMDAVLFPNIYKNINIFYQEGGHPVAVKQNNKWYKNYNGVVYNEMKGAYSEPTEHLFEGILKGLFPKTCYAQSSGGKPEDIKKLNFQQFLSFHNKCYTLDNSYIILYGKMDIEKMLMFLDKNYLSKQKEIEKWRSYKQTIFKNDLSWDNITQPLPHCNKIKLKTNPENSCCGCAFNIGKDYKKTFAVEILIDAIASSNESPLKHRLLQKNCAADITFEVENEFNNAFVFIDAKNIKQGLGDNLCSIIKTEIENITKNGIDSELLNAAIASKEFKLKENTPYCTVGIDTSLNILTEWLYNDSNAVKSLQYLDIIDDLKSKIGSNYFEKLALEIFTNNNSHTSVEIIPIDSQKQNLLQKLDAKEKDEVDNICKNLEKWQSKPDDINDIDKLPILKKSDIGKAKQLPNYIYKKTNIPCVVYDINTNGIINLNRYYSLCNLSAGDLPYVNILSNVLGKLDTTKHSACQIDTIWQEKLGHMNMVINFLDYKYDYNNLKIYFGVCCSVLEENSEYLSEFVDEIIYETKFCDTNKIKTILHQQKIMIEQSFITEGHIASLNRSLSQILPLNKAKEITSGIDYYLFLKDLLNNFDSKKEILCNKLKNISKKIFYVLPKITYMGNPKNINNIIDKISAKKFSVPVDNLWKDITLNSNKEAFIVPSNVNYCSLTNDLRLYNYKVDGSYVTASKIISLEYLWNQVRVKNGAYGAGMQVNLQGTMQFYSYRDPKIKETYNNYKNSSKWLLELNMNQLTLDNFIISSIAKLDAPQSSRSIMFYMDNCLLSNTDPNNKLEIRQEILNTKIKDLKKAAKLFETLIKDGKKCIFGGANITKENLENFEIIDLFNVEC